MAVGPRIITDQRSKNFVPFQPLVLNFQQLNSISNKKPTVDDSEEMLFVKGCNIEMKKRVLKDNQAEQGRSDVDFSDFVGNVDMEDHSLSISELEMLQRICCIGSKVSFKLSGNS